MCPVLQCLARLRLVLQCLARLRLVLQCLARLRLVLQCLARLRLVLQCLARLGRARRSLVYLPHLSLRRLTLKLPDLLRPDLLHSPLPPRTLPHRNSPLPHSQQHLKLPPKASTASTTVPSAVRPTSSSSPRPHSYGAAIAAMSGLRKASTRQWA